MTRLTNRHGRTRGLVCRRRSVVEEARGRLEVPVQHEGIKVGAVGPDHGAKLVVYSHLREEVRIGQRLKDGAVQLSGAWCSASRRRTGPIDRDDLLEHQVHTLIAVAIGYRALRARHTTAARTATQLSQRTLG